MVYETATQLEIEFKPSLEKVYEENQVVEMFASVLKIIERDRSELTTYLEQLEIDIKPALGEVYGEDKVDEMFANILEIIERARSERPISLKMDDIHLLCQPVLHSLLNRLFQLTVSRPGGHGHCR